MRILFVENHTIFAETVISEFLASHEVTVAPSLAAARQALAQSGFDVCLVDYDLDDGKGDQLVREISLDLPALPVVAVSSHDIGNGALARAGARTICARPDFASINVVLANLRIVARQL